MFRLDAPSEDVETVRTWFAEWGACVARQDYAAARAHFDESVIGFGTWMDMMDGLDRLETEQWRSIWGNISAFHHDTDTLRAGISPDRLMAFGVLIWTSTGYHQDGTSYDRPGRTTAVLVRDRIDAPWRAIHTHVSLFRGVPQKSYGAPTH